MDLDQLVFGCAPVGSFALDGDRDTGIAALRAALAHGITRFDAAPSYGDGHAESLLGAALTDTDRSRVQISTKVGRTAMANANPYARPSIPDAARGGGAFDFTAGGVRATLAASLDRLGLDHVDIVFLHDPECAPDLVRSEALPQLRRQRDDGIARTIGIATTDPAIALAFVEDGLIDHVMIAAAWTLTQRRAQRLLDTCAERGVPVYAAGPFDSGLLATPRPNPAAPSGYRAATPAAIELAHQLADIGDRHGITLPRLALQFPTRHPAVVAAVVGMRTPDEVDADIALLAPPVPDDVWAEVDALIAAVAAHA